MEYLPFLHLDSFSKPIFGDFFLLAFLTRFLPFPVILSQASCRSTYLCQCWGDHRGVKALGCISFGGTVPLQKYWNCLCARHSTVSVDTPTASGGSQPKIYWCYKHPQEKHDFLSVGNSIFTETWFCRSPSRFL